MNEPTPENLDRKVKDAMKWLHDISAIGNKHAGVIGTILQTTLVENARIRGVLMERLAPVLNETIGADVPKASILFALTPIRELLGYKLPYVAAGPVEPSVQ